MKPREEVRRARVLAAVRELTVQQGRALTQQEVADRAGESRWRVRQEVAVLAEQGHLRVSPGRRFSIDARPDVHVGEAS